MVSKKYILIMAYVVIAFSHQISQIGVWKNAPGFGSSMSMIAFAAAVIQDTIIIVWVADNIPTKYRGQVMSINIMSFMACKYIFNAFEKELNYLAVTAESGGCGQLFTHQGLTKKASIVVLGIFKWLNIIAALVIAFFYMERQDNDK